MIPFEFQLVTSRRPDETTLFGLLAALTDAGVAYESRAQSARYQLVAPHNTTTRDTFETPATPVTASLQHDPTAAELSLRLSLTTVDPPVPFTLGVTPADDAWRVRLQFSSAAGEREATFLGTVDLAVAVFESGPFTHGAYRGEYEPFVAVAPTDLVPNVLTLYGASAAATVGRDRLLSAPVHETRHLDGGGLALLACAHLDDRRTVRALQAHLGVGFDVSDED